jgi:cytochrome P450
MEQGEIPGKGSDLIMHMMRAHEDGERGMYENEIHINVGFLIPAGSETTTTALAGLFYYLGRNPEVYKVLAHEIHGVFKSEDDIHIKTTVTLQYLIAVIEETLRMYPPGAETPPRVSPGDIVGGYYIPEGVSSACPYSYGLCYLRP